MLTNCIIKIIQNNLKYMVVIEVRARLTRLFEIEYLKKNTEEFLNEVPIQRRYSM